MLVYALICLAFILVGVSGLQFSYMIYVDRLYRERRAYLQRLEKRTRRLEAKLIQAESLIIEQQEQLQFLLPDVVFEDIHDTDWADVIEEH